MGARFNDAHRRAAILSYEITGEKRKEKRTAFSRKNIGSPFSFLLFALWGWLSLSEFSTR
jgi:hypothetical protein